LNTLIHSSTASGCFYSKQREEDLIGLFVYTCSACGLKYETSSLPEQMFSFVYPLYLSQEGGGERCEKNKVEKKKRSSYLRVD